jgi:hypothetical protein
MWELHVPVREAMQALSDAGYPKRSRRNGGPRVGR